MGIIVSLILALMAIATWTGCSEWALFEPDCVATRQICDSRTPCCIGHCDYTLSLFDDQGECVKG